MEGSDAEVAGPVVFFGTPEWAVPSLRKLAAVPPGIELVVTNPDRPAGRGYETTAPPVKAVAAELGLEVLQPPSAKEEGLARRLREVSPEVAAVVAYGKILPAPLLEIPRLGFLNLHFSLLPEYRGAAPVQRAVMDGRTTTGVSIMVLTEGMDEGPVLTAQEVEIEPDETAGELGARLAELGGDLLASSLADYRAGAIAPKEQDHDRATYAPKVNSEEARIDWSQPAPAIKDKVRGSNPSPGAWTTFRNKRMKVHSVSEAPRDDLEPGAMDFDGSAWTVGTGRGCLSIVGAQMQGKRRLSGSDLGRGLRPRPGERFE